MDEFFTYYDLFNLRPEASHQEIKAAYKRLVKQWHPDRFTSDPVNLKIAEEKIKIINIAYEALKARQEKSYPGLSCSNTVSYATSIKTCRTSPRDYFDAAKRLAQLGQYREAAEELGHAVKLESKYAAAYHFRGILFTILGFERRGGSDLSRAAALGLASLDYDGEIITLVQTCEDFKYFRHLLRKDSGQHQETTENLGQPSSPSGASDSKGNYARSTSGHVPQSRSAPHERPNVKDIRQERQRQKQLEKEKLKHERLRQEQVRKKTPSSSGKNAVSSKIPQGESNAFQTPKNPADESVHSAPKSSQSSSSSVQIQAELDFPKSELVLSSMAMSVHGKTLATGSSHGCIDLWNYRHQRQFHTLKGHDGAVTQISFSVDNQILFSSGEDGTVRLWNLSDGSFIRSFLAHQGEVTGFKVCHLQKIAVTAGSDGVARVWALRENKLLREILHHESAISSMALNATGEVAVCGIADGSIRGCHTLRGGIVNWLTAHSQSVSALTMSPGEKILASGSSNGDVSLHHFPAGHRRQVCQSAQGGIMALAFCQQGRLLGGMDDRGRLMVWEVSSGMLLAAAAAHSPGKATLIAVGDDVLLSAGTDGRIRQWRLQGQC